MIRVTFAIVAMGFVLYCACAKHKTHQHYLVVHDEKVG